MNDNSVTTLLILLLAAALVWLIVKLRKVNHINKSLNKLNEELSSANNKLHHENAQLIAENAIQEAEQLKFQLQPHTLGNVVSTLNAIAKNLHRGTEAFAESLNYILYKGNSHLVSVEEEITFIKKYIQLNQLMYSDIITVTINDELVDRTSEFYYCKSIPHLISAYMIENAYKHGDKKHPDFLRIDLVLSKTSFEMRVINRLNPKSAEKKIGGLGLKNMEKRLELLLDGKYQIKRSCNNEEYHSTLIIEF